MPLNHLARFLYPKSDDWKSRKHLKTMFWVLLVALISGGFLAGMMLYITYKK